MAVPPARFPIRGLLTDPARLTRRRESYFQLLPQLAEWGCNTLWLHFCDDEGQAFRFRSHPELGSPSMKPGLSRSQFGTVDEFILLSGVSRLRAPASAASHSVVRSIVAWQHGAVRAGRSVSGTGLPARAGQCVS